MGLNGDAIVFVITWLMRLASICAIIVLGFLITLVVVDYSPGEALMATIGVFTSLAITACLLSASMGLVGAFFTTRLS